MATKYTVTLVYDVPVSKIVAVEAEDEEMAVRAAKKLAGDVEDNYELLSDRPDYWLVEEADDGN